jgi:7-carboxy-7-deazaguanine synthase
MDEKTQSLVDKGQMLPLMEEFYTIQGEGYHMGRAAYFIRIGGCDVGCHWCDVKESWNANLHPPTLIGSIVANSKPYSDTVVITGGEPLTWDMGPLTKQLKEAGKIIHIETCGAYPLSGTWDWICLSPKKTKVPLVEFYPHAHELKVVIYNNSDFKWAEEHAARVGENCKLFLQPEWSKKELMMPKIAEYVMANPKWQISIQSHKYMGLP